MILAQQGHALRAATLSGVAQALYAGQHRKAWEDSSLDTLIRGWRDGPDRDSIQAAFEAGRGMTADQAVAFALD